MSKDRDRRIPLGPPPGVPILPPEPDEETTGQHVRAVLEQLVIRLDSSEQKLGTRLDATDIKLAEAIQIDKDDHATMVGTMTGQNKVMDGHSTRLEKIESGVGQLTTQGETHGRALSDLATESARHGGQLKGMDITLNVMAKAIGVHGEVEAAKKKAEIETTTDVGKKRRELGYSVLKALALAAVGWLIAHFSGIH